VSGAAPGPRDDRAALREAARRALGEAPVECRPIGGGDVCLAFRLELAGGVAAFAKTPRAPRPGLLTAEADGLAWLAEARALRVPRVLGVAEADAGVPALLVLEWIESRPRGAGFDARLGRGLAALHAAGAPCFGAERDNWIGPLPQPNAPRASFARFWAEQRVLPLVRRAREAGRVGADLAARAERLCDRMEALAGPTEPPARLHGDLWAGNVIADERGEPCLVDPAPYGGHREVDLAMLRLFGGPGAACFAAYAEATPLAPGHAARAALFQLYPLLVHVNLFGSTYVAAFEAALARCERPA
jgi:fructosamine-3-kinase